MLGECYIIFFGAVYMLRLSSKAPGSFATIMHHDGEDLEAALIEAGMSIGRFAKAMEVERNTPRRWFTLVTLSSDRREQAAKVLRTTPEAIFKRLAKRENANTAFAGATGADTPVSQSGPRNVAQEPVQQYGDTAPQEFSLQDYRRCIEERDKWQQLAYENLNKYNELLVEHNQLLRLARLGTTTLSPILSH